ncbi:MAG: luciferase-like protein [Panacagrimonas sp.]|nr:LLM class flavin-dependent oxidoreductase [Panacagrimonas sp.]MCC2655291.1 luciferase-like protein [Panacagrimonas sp.]
MKMGVMFDFRNPEPWRKPYPEFYKSQIDQIVRTEELGFDNCWLTEHHFVEDGYNPATLTVAAAVAARTHRIRIGTFVLLMPFHNPVRLAEDVVSVDILSNGRFDLGVGQGYRAGEFSAFKIPRKERAPRMQEGIELVEKLFNEKNVTFNGRFTQVEGMTLYPRPVQEPLPIWIGCRAEKATARAARMGFHLMATIGPDPAPTYRQQLKDAGRNPADFNVAQLRVVYTAKTADQAWEEAAPHLHHMLRLYGVWLSEANDAEGDAAMSEIPPPEKLRHSPYAEGMMIGTPDEVARKMEKFRSEFDCSHFVMGTQLPGADPAKVRRALELFAKEVMPSFQTR